MTGEGLAGSLEALLIPLSGDQRVGPVHLCLYLALFVYSGGRRGWFFVGREEVMALAKIKGIRTYYRTMKDLVNMGVLEYWPSRNGKTVTRVKLMVVGPPPGAG